MSKSDEVKRPILFMLVGLPGSGKSTFRNSKEMKSVSCVSSDDHIEKWAKENNTTYNKIFKEKVKQAAECLNEDVQYYTENDHDFIWDQTNLNVKTRKQKLAKIPSNYKKVAVVFKTSVEECLKRNAKRERSIPENIIRRMAESYEEPTKDEGFDAVINYQG